MKYSFYLGCVIPYRVPNYELSTRRIAEELGIDLVDLEGFSCCGFPIKNVNYEAALLSAARNLCLAEEMGLDVCVICSACASVLKEANKKLKEDDSLRDKINERLSQIGREFKGMIEVRNFTRILYEDIGVEKLKDKVVKDMSGFKLAAHYGCHYLKPSDIHEGFDEPEDPKTLDELIEVTGAESINYEGKKQCCGNVIVGIDQNVSFAMAKKKLDHIKASGADAVIVICPACGLQYDANQRTIESKFNVDYKLPVLYYPQLLGLAMGIGPTELGLNLNRVEALELLEKSR